MTAILTYVSPHQTLGPRECLCSPFFTRVKPARNLQIKETRLSMSGCFSAEHNVGIKKPWQKPTDLTPVFTPHVKAE